MRSYCQINLSCGANGISIVINYVFGISPAIVLYAINIPLLVLCFTWERGRCQNHLWQSYLSIFVGITSGMPVLTHNIFLAHYLAVLLQVLA